MTWLPVGIAILGIPGLVFIFMQAWEFGEAVSPSPGPSLVSNTGTTNFMQAPSPHVFKPEWGKAGDIVWAVAMVKAVLDYIIAVIHWHNLQPPVSTHLVRFKKVCDFMVKSLRATWKEM